MPITREGKLLNSIANGVYSGVQPVTREEQYLSYIAGESYTKPESPITRKEVFLDKIPQGGSSGGGVTIRNQNKTITENGTYTADSGYTGLGTVTVNVESSGSTGENKLAKLVDRSITEITAEDLQGATQIGHSAFRSCDNLKTVTFPASVTMICGYAFHFCGIKKVTIPDSVTTIENYAFYACSGLNEIVIKRAIPPTLGSSAFQGSNYIKKIIVPTGCADAYKAATNWSEYADIIVEEGAENLITFTIGGTSYQAEPNMTWGEWVNSAHNNINAYDSAPTSNAGVIWNGSGTQYVMNVYNADTITAGGAYEWSKNNGGAN